ncbi:MAG: hypothetical protein AAFU55_14465, partial [Pseudomonadota bacterium]
PELDGDQDGVPFARDACPEEPIYPEQDPRYSDGCPKLAELSGDRIAFRGEILRPDGSETHATSRDGGLGDAEAMGVEAGEELRARGGPDFFTA